MTYLQLFYGFLKQNHIYHLFVHNMRNRVSKKWCYDIKNISTYRSFYFVDDAFRWSDTNEGFDFWYNINTKWRDILRNTSGHNTITLYNLKGNDII